MNAELVTELKARAQRATTRARIVSRARPDDGARRRRSGRSSQPDRITFLHPHGEGFWWLAVEPPLLVIAVGLLFHFVVAPGLLADLEERVTPPPEHVHWLFATGFLMLGLCLRRRGGRRNGGLDAARVAAYLWPGHRLRARRAPVARDGLLHELDDPHARPRHLGTGADAGRRNRARARARQAAEPVVASRHGRAFVVSGAAFLVHEQNAWLFQRSAFLHHLLGWTLLVSAVFPLARCVRPRSHGRRRRASRSMFVVVAVMLYCDRDVAPIFGHISPLAGTPHR